MFKLSKLLSTSQIKDIFGKQNKVINVTLLNKNKKFTFVQWKGETEKFYFFIYYMSGALYLSMDERELKCLYHDNIICVGSLENLIELENDNNITVKKLFEIQYASTNFPIENDDELFNEILKFLKWRKAKNLEIMKLS